MIRIRLPELFFIYGVTLALLVLSDDLKLPAGGRLTLGSYCYVASIGNTRDLNFDLGRFSPDYTGDLSSDFYYRSCTEVITINI